MLTQAILPDTCSATSSPVLVAGATPCVLPDGPTIDLFGRVVAPASPSAPQALKKAPLMIDTSGLFGSISSASAALELSLVSRLKQRLTTDGSILFNLIWKVKATPAGRQVYRLRASARRTLDKDCGSWPTPNTPSGGPNFKSTPTHTGGMDLEGAVTLTSWPTTSTRDYKGGYRGGRMRHNKISTDTLDVAAQLMSLPTPATRDHHAQGAAHNAKAQSSSLATVWEKKAPPIISGLTAIGSPAATENHGQLNPAHSRWLMGLPPEWDACAPTATPSSRKSRKSL